MRRLEVFRTRLAGRTVTDHAPDRPIITITAVRQVGPTDIVLDYIDHTTPGDPAGEYAIGLNDGPDEDDVFLADMYLQNLIEDLLAADD